MALATRGFLHTHMDAHTHTRMQTHTCASSIYSHPQRIPEAAQELMRAHPPLITLRGYYIINCSICQS